MHARSIRFTLVAAAVAFTALSGCGGAKSEPPATPGGAVSSSPPGGDEEEPGGLGDSEAEPSEPSGDGKKANESAAATGDDDAPTPTSATVDQTLSGTLSQKDIHAIVVKHGALFDDCYSIGAAGGKDFVATVTIKATVGPSGNVNSTQVLKSTAKNPRVDECVEKAFKKMQFPKPADGATSTITFPMKFEGVQQVE